MQAASLTSFISFWGGMALPLKGSFLREKHFCCSECGGGYFSYGDGPELEGALYAISVMIRK